jgi:3-hydroxyisobutyrate dehydrogenase
MTQGADRLAFVGLGNMGLPMAERLVGAGFEVVGFDVDPVSQARATAAGVPIESCAARAVSGAAGVILMLPNSDIVEAVVRDQDLQGALDPGTTIVDMSSSEPLRTRALAGELAAVGLHLVDAPVSGGVKGARSGRLTIMAGGSQGQLARTRWWLEPLGDVIPTGNVGSGHAMKALNNLLSASHLLATSEVMVAGERFGLDPQMMLSVFNRSSGMSGSTQNKFPNFILPGNYDSGFALRLMVKDMRIAVGIAESSHSPHRLASTSLDLWDGAARELPDTADHTEIERWLRSLAERHSDGRTGLERQPVSTLEQRPTGSDPRP